MKIKNTEKFLKQFSKLKNPVALKRLNKAINKFVNSQTGDIGGYSQDHPLQGTLKGYRELHLDGDDLLVYKIENNLIIFHGIFSNKELNNFEGSFILFSFLNFRDSK